MKLFYYSILIIIYVILSKHLRGWQEGGNATQNSIIHYKKGAAAKLNNSFAAAPQINVSMNHYSPIGIVDELYLYILPLKSNSPTCLLLGSFDLFQSSLRTLFLSTLKQLLT